MGKHRKKLSGAEKAERRRRRRQYMTVFMNGKQKRLKRPGSIDGIDEDTFIQGYWAVPRIRDSGGTAEMTTNLAFDLTPESIAVFCR